MSRRFPTGARLAEILTERLPGAGPIAPLRIVGEGFRSIAYETRGGILFRIGKIAEAADGFELERRILPFIRDHTTATVPDPRWHIPPCEELPFGALGYPMLPGTTPVPDDPNMIEHFAPELARFLADLHSMPVEGAIDLGTPVVHPVERLLGARPVVMPVLKDHLQPAAHARIERWWDALARRGQAAENRLSVCHHDLWHENLLVDSAGHLSGVLDWSHVEVGDPMHDFAAIHHFGKALTATVIAEYEAASGSLASEDRDRTRLYWEGRQLGGLAWAVEHDDHAEIESAIRKILAGPIFG